MCSALSRVGIARVCNRGRLSVLSHHLSTTTTRMASSPQEIVVNSDGPGRIKYILLNRPHALNALNLNMANTIYQEMSSIQSDPNVKCVIMEGGEDKAFCAGGDIRAVTDAGRSGDSLAQDFFKAEYRLNHLIGTYKKPFIAIQDGITMGGGVGLSVHGDFRIATEFTLFAMPETFIGLFPDVGGGYFLPRLQGSLGMYLALTGYRLKSRDTMLGGVATHFIPRARIPVVKETLSELCAGLTNETTDPSHMIKQQLDSLHDKYSTEHAQSELSLAPHMNVINRCFSQPSVEEIITTLEEEKTEWAQQQIKTLSKMSPTSLKITHRQLTLGADLSLADALIMEYRMSQGCMANSDFYEGVRALLVDRDNAPKWTPPTLAAVTDTMVDSYFSPPQGSPDLVL